METQRLGESSGRSPGEQGHMALTADRWALERGTGPAGVTGLELRAWWEQVAFPGWRPPCGSAGLALPGRSRQTKRQEQEHLRF